MKKIKKPLFIIIICCFFIFIIGCEKEKIKSEKMKEDINFKNKQEEFKPIFTQSIIPDDIYNKMIGKSIPNKNEVDISTLSYLKITHYGFDDKTHLGEMIVNKDVAKEVLDIFKELYEKKYPIDKIKLIDEYDAQDDLSMKDNNTSAFCYREISGSKVLSNHSKGMAIDINPLINPMVKKNIVSPEEGEKYIDREVNTKGMIIKGDACYEAFAKRGWTWGGDWDTLKDYQHFEK
ncbi:MAG: M15 family metallopeptidase [Paraclostridium sp.]|uniref:M15 family metallopeptidase n=1 Tax=Paraclostridium sp. TaxID=2023273 RepID=UPI003F2F1EFA